MCWVATKSLLNRYETKNHCLWPRYFQEVKQTRRFVFTADSLSLTPPICVSCISSTPRNDSCILGSTVSVHGVALFPHQTCPAFIQPSDLSACKRDRGLLLTPAISSTLLRNAPFPPLSSWNDGQSARLTSNKVPSCLLNGLVILPCLSYEHLPGILHEDNDEWGLINIIP